MSASSPPTSHLDPRGWLVVKPVGVLEAGNIKTLDCMVIQPDTIDPPDPDTPMVLLTNGKKFPNDAHEFWLDGGLAGLKKAGRKSWRYGWGDGEHIPHDGDRVTMILDFNPEKTHYKVTWELVA